MLRALFNWLKSLFLSCFGCGNPAPEAEEHEVSPLLVSEDDQEEDNQAERHASTEHILAALQEPPVTLTDAEIKLILYYGQKGMNDYIDNLEPKKKELAYALLNEEVHKNVIEIDVKMGELLQLNKNANREAASWNRIKQYFLRGDASEYSLAPCLESFQGKHTSVNDQPYDKDSQNNIIDQIITCFKTCKAILNLHLFKQKLHAANLAFAPGKDDIKRELYREETKLNRKTLDTVNDFNKRADEYEREVEKQENSRQRKYRTGGRK